MEKDENPLQVRLSLTQGRSHNPRSLENTLYVYMTEVSHMTEVSARHLKFWLEYFS